MTRTQLVFAFFMTLLIFVLVQVCLILLPFINPIFWASIIAFATYPIYEKLKSLFKNNSVLASFVATIIVFCLTVPLFVFLIYNLAHEAVELYRWILKAIREGKHEILMEEIKHWPGIRTIGDMIGWEKVETNAREWAVKSAESIGHFTAKQIAGFTKNILLGTVNFFLAFFLVFFIFKDGKKVTEFIYTLTPLEERDKQEIFGQIGETFSAVIRGQLLTALVQALVAGVIFWSLDLPLPVFFAALTFLVAMIPVFGAATVWFPFVVYLYFAGDHWKAFTLFALGVGVISLIDNILKPILIGSKLKLPYLLLLLGILGGLKVYGMMGIFLAPTVLSLFFVLVRTYKERFLA